MGFKNSFHFPLNDEAGYLNGAWWFIIGPGENHPNMFLVDDSWFAGWSTSYDGDDGPAGHSVDLLKA